jgi:hypothetical protein
MRSDIDMDRPYLGLPKDKICIPLLRLLRISRFDGWYEEKHIFGSVLSVHSHWESFLFKQHCLITPLV